MLKVIKIIGLAVAGLVWYAGVAKAQRVQFSEPVAFDFRASEFDMPGKLGDKLFVFRKDKELNVLDALDENMQRLASIVLDFMPEKAGNLNFVSDGKTLMLTYQQLRRSGEMLVYAAVLDDQARLIGGPMVIDSVITRNERYRVAISPDKQRMVVYLQDRRNGTSVLRWTAIDRKMQVAGNYEQALPADGLVKSIYLTNDGQWIGLQGSGMEDQLSANLNLLVCPLGGHTFSVLPANLEGRYIGDAMLRYNTHTGKAYVAGFSSSTSKGNIDGLYYGIALPTSGSWQKTAFMPFDEVVKEGAGGNKKRAFNDYIFRELIITKDEGFLMAAEKYYTATRQMYASGMGMYPYYYNPYYNRLLREFNYSDVMLLSCSAEGERKWSDFIRKDQTTLEDDGAFSGYGMMNTGDAIRFVFNNMESASTTLKVISVNPVGKMNTNLLDRDYTRYYDWLPRYGKQISARQMLVPCIYKGKLCFAKVDF